MNSKPHRTNSDFQLRHFLAGSCFTADGAWMLLYGQKIDIEGKLSAARSAALRTRANRIYIASIMENPNVSEVEKLKAEADLVDLEGMQATWEMNVAGAEAELGTIVALMAELEPQRKYADLPLLEASEATQREEWLGELKRRAEYFLLTCGTIPHDHFDTMRCHPDFADQIAPFIADFTKRLDTAVKGGDSLAALASSQPLLGALT